MKMEIYTSGQVAATCIYTAGLLEVTAMYGWMQLCEAHYATRWEGEFACMPKKKRTLIRRGTKCGALLWRMQKIMEKAWTVLGAESKRNGAEREHPIQFPNCAGSEYKHKGFITGRSLLKAGANSASSSTRRESGKHGRRGRRWREQQEDRHRNTKVEWHQEGAKEDETRKNNISYLAKKAERSVATSPLGAYKCTIRQKSNDFHYVSPPQACYWVHKSTDTLSDQHSIYIWLLASRMDEAKNTFNHRYQYWFC